MAGNWWLRSPNSDNSNNASNVNSDGNVNNNNVNNSNGLSPDLLPYYGCGARALGKCLARVRRNKGTSPDLAPLWDRMNFAKGG